MDFTDLLEAMEHMSISATGVLSVRLPILIMSLRANGCRDTMEIRRVAVSRWTIAFSMRRSNPLSFTMPFGGSWPLKGKEVRPLRTGPWFEEAEQSHGGRRGPGGPGQVHADLLSGEAEERSLALC